MQVKCKHFQKHFYCIFIFSHICFPIFFVFWHNVGNLEFISPHVSEQSAVTSQTLIHNLTTALVLPSNNKQERKKQINVLLFSHVSDSWAIPTVYEGKILSFNKPQTNENSYRYVISYLHHIHSVTKTNMKQIISVQQFRPENCTMITQK